MKNLILLSTILIILFKTGNVLSNTNIFNVNNVKISKENSTNRAKLINQAFKESFLKLINKLLLEDDYQKLTSTNLEQIKKLISYYQIINSDNKEDTKDIKVNVFFDKNKVHNFFYQRNILYSDITNTEIVLFPLLRNKNEYFIYSQNYFFKNWNIKNQDNLIQYILPLENIENIQKINFFKKNIYELDITDFFKEYENNNLVFATIEINNDVAEIFLNTKIENKSIKKKITLKKNKALNEEDFYNNIILEINKILKDLIKSQNLIDVRTPSFLNVEIKLEKKSNLVEFNNRLKKIDLIDNFYIQELNKDYALVKIKYLGKIENIISKLKSQNINLQLIKGQWKLTEI